MEDARRGMTVYERADEKPELRDAHPSISGNGG